MTQVTNRAFSKSAVLSCLVMTAALASTTTSSAQTDSAAFYHYVVVPQLNAQAAAEAEIRSRPSNWGPGEIRDAVNYGAIAWYQKGPGQYGYVFNQGSIRDISASLNVDIECTRRRITCEGKQVIVNEWLVIGSFNNRTFFATAKGPTRAAAEATLQDYCRREGTTCTIKDAFEVMPHRRGVSFQRLKTVVR